MEQGSCTAGQVGAVRTVLMEHDCHKRPRAQQKARELRGTGTWCFLRKIDDRCSIRKGTQEEKGS